MSDNSKAFYKEGSDYLKAALGKGEKHSFNAELRSSITLMAIEKFCMAIILHKKSMADNHTFGDLQNSLVQVYPQAKEWKEDFDFLDTFQEICSLDEYKRRIASEEEVSRCLGIASYIEKVASEIVGGE